MRRMVNGDDADECAAPFPDPYLTVNAVGHGDQVRVHGNRDEVVERAKLERCGLPAFVASVTRSKLQQTRGRRPLRDEIPRARTAVVREYRLRQKRPYG